MADSLMDEISVFVEENCEAEILDENREMRWINHHKNPFLAQDLDDLSVFPDRSILFAIFHLKSEHTFAMIGSHRKQIASN